MKNNFFLGLITTLSMSIASGSNFNGIIINNKSDFKITLTQSQDTIKYLEAKVVSQKGKFKHQELNLLLKELNLKVKSYLLHFELKPMGDLKSITLFFDNNKVISGKLYNRQDIPLLTVYFDNKISKTAAYSVDNKGLGDWNEKDAEFYGKLIIKDVFGLQPRKKQ